MKVGALQRKFFSSAREKGAEEFTELYRTHRDLVSAVIFQTLGAKASSQLLNDLVQETFVKVWKGLSKFRNDSEIKSWVYRVSVNTALDFLKSRAAREEATDHDFDSIDESKRGVDDKIANEQIVELGLRNLSEEHRVVLVLALLHELPLEEIANVLEIPIGTVKSRLHNAKEKFKETLSKNGVSL